MPWTSNGYPWISRLSQLVSWKFMSLRHLYHSDIILYRSNGGLLKNKCGEDSWAAPNKPMLNPDETQLNPNKWMFPKKGVPQNGWFIMESPIKMDDWGVPLFLETPNWIPTKLLEPDFFRTPASCKSWSIWRRATWNVATRSLVPEILFKPCELRNKPSYFPLNPGCLIGILIVLYCNPSITG